MEEATLSPSATKIWNQLESGGFENIPRKKAKFTNFIQNSMRTGDKKAIEEIWSVFEKSFNQQRKEQQTQAKGLILKPHSSILSIVYQLQYY